MEYILWGSVIVSGLTLILISILSRMQYEFHATTTIEEILEEEANNG